MSFWKNIITCSEDETDEDCEINQHCASTKVFFFRNAVIDYKEVNLCCMKYKSLKRIAVKKCTELRNAGNAGTKYFIMSENKKIEWKVVWKKELSEVSIDVTAHSINSKFCKIAY